MSSSCLRRWKALEALEGRSGLRQGRVEVELGVWDSSTRRSGPGSSPGCRWSASPAVATPSSTGGSTPAMMLARDTDLVALRLTDNAWVHSRNTWRQTCREPGIQRRRDNTPGP
ncbi:hypothetical protein AB0469_15105 [Streptomyces sp. NPDC093801]|uniref:hypothetical protein n=1 Tax=Streptomyces sp. NPDC093801 TaxID=3155203 RepID=UPI00344CD677